MGGLAKLALSLGNTAIATVSLISICLVIVAGFFGLQNLSDLQYKGEQERQQQQIATQLYALSSSKILQLEKQVATLAKSEKVIALLQQGDYSAINNQQNELLSFFPDAQNVCLLSVDVDDVDPNACIPISFATLNSIRQAKIDGSASIGLMKKGTDDAHVLMAQQVIDKGDNLVGVVLVTLKPNVVNGLLAGSADFQGYLELQQGTKKWVVLAKSGDASMKVGQADFIKKLPNTYWQIYYWSPKNSITPSISLMGLGAVLGLVLLLWLLREGVRGFLFKRDVATLRQQITDLRAGSLKPHYPLSFSVMRTIESDIQMLGRESYWATSKKGATAESISKKIGENEPGDSAERSESETLGEQLHIEASIFKANDIRGIVGHTLDEDVIRVIGQAIGSDIADQGERSVVVGRDGRLSSANLSNALIEGLLASGRDVVDIGEVPTPILYFACEHLNIPSGMMVTGSHIPGQYNGLKTLINGQVLSGKKLQAVYQRILQANYSTGKGTLSEANVVKDYVGRIVGDLMLPRSIKVVIDCGNGVAGGVAPALFEALGCDVIELYCDVDGHFPNHHPNPSVPENLHDLSEAVKQHGAELGIAFDGDGDRVGVVDGYGEPIWPDRLMMLFSQDILSRIAGATIVYDVKCSNLLGEEISKAGGQGVMAKSGYAFIRSEMQERDAPLAGEMSGHIFFKERWYGFDDGLYAAARLLELISNDSSQRRATEILAAIPKREGTAEILVEMDEGESQKFIRQLAGEGRFDGAEVITIDGLRAEYPNGWGLVRSSNTTPGLTLRFEADSLDELDDIQQRFKQQMLQIKPTLILLF